MGVYDVCAPKKKSYDILMSNEKNSGTVQLRTAHLHEKFFY